MTTPEQLRLESRALVYKNGERAASLERTEDGVAFEYTPDWIEAGREPVASTLPVSSARVLRPSGAVPAFFEGLLPEGRRLSALRGLLKTSVDDELSLLMAVGSDAVGDVMVIPAEIAPLSDGQAVEVGHPADIRFADLLAEIGVNPHRGSLPGVQDKVSARMISLPVASRGDRFILKLNPPEFPHLVENEAFFLAASRLSDVRTVEASVITDREGVPGLLVRRFDRVSMEDRVEAIAVEDGCQTLGVAPADKYRVETVEVFKALCALCDARIVAARELLTQLAFAYLTGNGDAHAKNFSVLQQSDGEWRIAPAYDLPSSRLYGDTSMAMPWGRRTNADYGRTDFVELGSELDVPAKAVISALDALCDRVELWIGDLEKLPFDSGVTRKLKRLVMNRRDRLTGAK